MPTAHSQSLWTAIRSEAMNASQSEPNLASFFHGAILTHDSFHEAISHLLAQALDCQYLSAMQVRALCAQALRQDRSIEDAMLNDLKACFDRDPACHQLMLPLLYFKGYQALQAYRVIHWYWHQNRRSLALFLSQRVSERFHVDIHPAATIGSSVLMDHATEIVIGETVVIENDVSLLHGVTLGGQGCHGGIRHPTVNSGVMLGAGSYALGAIEIGKNAKIASGSVLAESVPANATVAGVPARVVARPKTIIASPSSTMDQGINGELRGK